MTGILKEKSEIEKLKREYQILAEQNFDTEKNTSIPPTALEVVVLEECEL